MEAAGLAPEPEPDAAMREAAAMRRLAAFVAECPQGRLTKTRHKKQRFGLSKETIRAHARSVGLVVHENAECGVFTLLSTVNRPERWALFSEAEDLARLAGLSPAAVIVEIMNPDGTMARRPELEVFAKEHGLNMGTIADLIEYRSLHEQSVELCSAEPIHTEWGPFTLHTFRDLIDDTLHFSLSLGDLSQPGAIPVRVQPVNTLRDLLGTQLDASSAPGWSYRTAMNHIANAGEGVVVLLGGAETPATILEDLDQLLHAEQRPSPPQNYRLIGTGAQILRHLGLGDLQLMSAPLHFNALSGFNLNITDFLAAPGR